MRLVRSDAKGLFIRYGDIAFRPGDVAGTSHVHNQSDGNLIAGIKVKANPIYDGSLMKILTPDGLIIYWSTEYQVDLEIAREKYRKENPDLFAKDMAQLKGFFQPRMIKKIS